MMEATAPLGTQVCAVIWNLIFWLDLDQRSHAECWCPNLIAVEQLCTAPHICFLFAVGHFQFRLVHYIHLDIMQRDDNYWSEMQLQLLCEWEGLYIGFHCECISPELTGEEVTEMKWLTVLQLTIVNLKNKEAGKEPSFIPTIQIRWVSALTSCSAVLHVHCILLPQLLHVIFSEVAALNTETAGDATV